MHKSSFAKAELFVKHYLLPQEKQNASISVLEIGSKSYSAQETYRPLFETHPFTYKGLDIEVGPNVDIVPANSYVWDEIENESFDACVSGQTFEHNPYFWVTFAEMARILTPGGYAFIVAPGAGEVHRYPYDCWRFYPDSWLSLCALTGMELVESYFESDETARVVPSAGWRDCAAIVRKPELTNNNKAAFYNQLAAIVAPLKSAQFDIGKPLTELGPCFTEYETRMLKENPPRPLKDLRKKLRRTASPDLLKGDSFLGG